MNMPSQRIDITGTQHGASLTTAVAQTREARDRFKHAKAVMEATIVDGDYSGVEQLFGAPEGTGETLYNLVAGVVTDLDGFNIDATIARMG
jgi:hypothetical protein